MRRVLLMIVVALSTMLLGAVLADWLHSLTNSETLVFVHGDRIFAIDNVSSQVSFWRGELTAEGRWALIDGWYHEHWEAPHMRRAQEFEEVNLDGEDLWCLGFAITTTRRFPTTVETVTYEQVANVAGVVVPLWALTLLLAVVTIVGVAKLRRADKRSRAGLCAVCGYDLRASSERCPECGSPIAAPTDRAQGGTSVATSVASGPRSS
jgi:hypothetical protein